MKSQVSFKFDGSHNKDLVVRNLTSKLNNLKYKFENVNKDVFRIYVGSNNTDEEVMNVCKGIQCFAIYDNTKTLK